MTFTQETRGVISGAGGMESVHLLLTEGDVRMMADDPKRVMEELEARATQLSAVLEEILQEPHGEPRWGLNE
jgi:hypothetical protein